MPGSESINSSATEYSGIPASYGQADLRGVIGPDRDGSIGVSFDCQTGAIARLKISRDDVEVLLRECAGASIAMRSIHKAKVAESAQRILDGAASDDDRKLCAEFVLQYHP